MFLENDASQGVRFAYESRQLHKFLKQNMAIIEAEREILPDGSVYYVSKDPTLYYAIKETGNGQVIVNIGKFEKLARWVKSLGNNAVGIRIQPDKPSEDIV